MRERSCESVVRDIQGSADIGSATVLYCITSISGSILADKGCSFTLAPSTALEKLKIIQGYHILLFNRVCQVTAVDFYVK